MKDILGIHHITAIAGDPQDNIDFYVGILGLRLVKKTINFDDPQTYHLYYGDKAGNPGTLLTFFPWTSSGFRGQAGAGQVTTISFSVPPNSLPFWIERLQHFGVAYQKPFIRFDRDVLAFHDSDGLQLELISGQNRPGHPWVDNPVPAEYAIQGFYSATLSLSRCEATAELMTKTLDFKPMEKFGNRTRYVIGDGYPGTLVDLVCLPSGNHGRMGIGAVHHIAWRTSDGKSQLKKREELYGLGYNVTPVIDRKYFQSIYFREPGGVLFEIATDPPGFTVDEAYDRLGTKLQLPKRLEPERQRIEKALPSINMPASLLLEILS